MKNEKLKMWQCQNVKINRMVADIDNNYEHNDGEDDGDDDDTGKDGML